MTAVGNELINNDPIVARNFYLDMGGNKNVVLSGIAGFDIEMDVVSVQQNGAGGQQQHVKTLGGVLKAPEMTVTRMAPLKTAGDPIWTWFNGIRNAGMKADSRAQYRKHISIVLCDSSFDEVGRFNLLNAWPSKIASDSLSTDSNEAMKENITFQCERIDRIAK